MMKKITCELCGSNDFIKEDEVFVCTYCRTKYSVEEAKKLLIDGAVTVNNIAGIESLMKRGYLALEDSHRQQAAEYFNKVLDIMPEHAPAWIGMVLAERGLKEETDLTKFGWWECSHHFKKALRFANEDYRTKLKGYIESYTTSLIKNGYAALGTGDSPTAKTCFNNALSYTPNHVPTLIGLLLTELNCYKFRDDDGDMCTGYKAEFKYETDLTKALCPLENYPTFQEAIKYADVDYRTKLENYNKVVKERISQKIALQEKEKQKKEWQRQGRCHHCGGKISFFSRKCKSCGIKN